ncbi:uncharacterized protein [Salminus brasiliensis]|uniref:uncharacterized protein n=1 Tax=Salminus brasiliensis TaxID=930266 RepID=UPI003B82D363
MSTSNIGLWTTIALCVAMGRADVFYKQTGQGVLMDCGDADENSGFEWKHNTARILRVDKNGIHSKGNMDVVKRTKINRNKLQISSVQVSDSGVYSCTGQNQKGSITQWHTLHVITVSVSPSKTVLISTEVNLTCDLPGDSKAQVQWLKQPGDHPRGRPGNKVVMLRSVTLADAGSWTCQIKDNKNVEKIEVDISVVGPLKSSSPLTVPSGSDTTLPCILQSPSALTIVEGGWKRDPATDLHLPTLRRDASGLQWKGSKSSAAFSDGPLSTNFSVTLKNVQPSDSGVYVCTLTFEDGKSLNASLNLKVDRDSAIVATGRPVITAPLGGAVDLPCTIDSSSDDQHVVGGKWLRKPPTDVRLPTLISTGDGLRWNTADVNGSKVTFSDQWLMSNFTVTLNNMERADAGVYVCSLTLQDGSDWSMEFELKVEGKEVIVASGIGPQPNDGGFWKKPVFLGLALWIWVAVAAGSLLLLVLVFVTVLVQCRSKRTRRKALKNKIQMPSNQELVPMQKECPAKKTERQPRPRTQDRPLPPIPKHQYKQIKMAASETYLWICLALCVAMGGSAVLYKRSGEEVMLDCGNADQNKEFEWKFENDLIIKMSKTGTQSKGNVAAKAKVSGIKLKIPTLTTTDSGTYRCSGVDENKRTVKQEHTLHVVSVKASPSQMVMHSSNVNLSCEIPSSPKAEVRWIKPGSTVTYIFNKVLTLKSVNLTHAGTWICQIGKIEALMDLNITVLGPLKSTRNVSAGKGSSANLTCSVPNESAKYVSGGNWSCDHNNCPKLPTLSRDSKGLKWNPGQTSSPVQSSVGQHGNFTDFTVTLTKVSNEDKGTYVCSVTFQNGITLNTQVVLNVVDVATEGGGLLGVGMWVWITAAAAFVLIIGLVVAITLIHQRNKRIKIKVRKLKSMRQPLTARNYCQCNRSERSSQPHPGKRERPPPLPRYQYEVMDS